MGNFSERQWGFSVSAINLTTADLKAIVVMALAVAAKDGRDCNPALTRRYLALLFDGMRPTGQALPSV